MLSDMDETARGNDAITESCKCRAGEFKLHPVEVPDQDNLDKQLAASTPETKPGCFKDKGAVQCSGRFVARLSHNSFLHQLPALRLTPNLSILS
jgi:hypothetical protein